MKLFILVVSLFLLPTVSLAQALTLEWDRNPDAAAATATTPEIQPTESYQVWFCAPRTCTDAQLVKVPGAIVPQPAAGVKPSYVIPAANRQGRYAVSALNTAFSDTTVTPPVVTTNESGLSVSVVFSAIGANAPGKLKIK